MVLIPSIETVAVIDGEKCGSTKGMTARAAVDHNVAAVHYAPVRARQCIREGATRALARSARSNGSGSTRRTSW